MEIIVLRGKLNAPPSTTCRVLFEFDGEECILEITDENDIESLMIVWMDIGQSRRLAQWILDNVKTRRSDGNTYNG